MRCQLVVAISFLANAALADSILVQVVGDGRQERGGPSAEATEYEALQKLFRVDLETGKVTASQNIGARALVSVAAKRGSLFVLSSGKKGPELAEIALRDLTSLRVDSVHADLGYDPYFDSFGRQVPDGPVALLPGGEMVVVSQTAAPDLKEAIVAFDRSKRVELMVLGTSESHPTLLDYGDTVLAIFYHGHGALLKLSGTSAERVDHPGFSPLSYSGTGYLARVEQTESSRSLLAVTTVGLLLERDLDPRGTVYKPIRIVPEGKDYGFVQDIASHRKGTVAAVLYASRQNVRDSLVVVDLVQRQVSTVRELPTGTSCVLIRDNGAIVLGQESSLLVLSDPNPKPVLLLDGSRIINLFHIPGGA